MATQIAILNREVRPGLRFQHAHWGVRLPDGTVRPEKCTVTAVRRGVVHYRSESGRRAASYPSSFVTVVHRWLDEAA